MQAALEGNWAGRYAIACGRWNDERGRCGTMRSGLERTTRRAVAAGRSQMLLGLRYTRRGQRHVPTRKEKVSKSLRSRSSQFRGGRSWPRKGTRRFG